MKKPTQKSILSDEESSLITEIKAIIDERPTYGYRLSISVQN